MLRPGRTCEFPFLAGATFAGFLLSQAVGIAYTEVRVPAGFHEALIMSILCAGMCYLGYVVNDKPMAGLDWQFDNNRLLVVSAVLTAVGTFFFALIWRMPDELTATGAWSGPVIAYYFFAQVLRYGFALAFLVYARTGSKWAIAIAACNGPVLFDLIVIRGRRYYAIETFLVILCSFWFARRQTLPRWAILCTLAVGVLAVGGASAYRTAMYKGQTYGGNLQHDIPWDEILEIDFVDIFVTSQKKEAYELRNLAYIIHTTDTHDVGLSYWNEIVYVYVPAQLLGKEFKASLQFDVPGEVFDPNSNPGTTTTGMGDSYQAFAWCGCLVFFLIAYAMRRLFETAQSGLLAAQLAYMLIVTGAMHTVTHHTKWFVVPWIHMAMFLLPGLLWARKPDAAQCAAADC
jgi:hypothetical protein